MSAGRSPSERSRRGHAGTPVSPRRGATHRSSPTAGAMPSCSRFSRRRTSFRRPDPGQFCPSPFMFSPAELASGLVFGTTGPGPAVPSDVPADPLVALESAMLPALLRGPCVVSFSGGRDSSAVLAAATALARREGLPLPVPATNVFRSARWAGESEWQERVVAHLGLDDSVRLELRDELDCVGPIARSIAERHGLLWPFNVHFHWPLLDVARGGSLLTGIGGDELLGTSRWARAAAVLSRSVRPVPRDLFSWPGRVVSTRSSAGAAPASRSGSRLAHAPSKRAGPGRVEPRPGPRARSLVSPAELGAALSVPSTSASILFELIAADHDVESPTRLQMVRSPSGPHSTRPPPVSTTAPL